jgi:hypothetical protein
VGSSLEQYTINPVKDSKSLSDTFFLYNNGCNKLRIFLSFSSSVLTIISTVSMIKPKNVACPCNLFEKFSSFLQWVVETRCGLHSIDHYLDDFILVGRKFSND